MNRFTKLLLGLLILTAVMISGCINSNKSNSPINEPQVINAYPEQLILNENEIKEVLGDEWEMVSNIGYSYSEDHVGGYEVLDKKPYSTKGKQLTGESFISPIMIWILVFNETNAAKNYYSGHELFDMKDYKGNKINIGDAGIYSIKIEPPPEPLNKIITKITFRKNNVISIMYLDSEKSDLLNMDTAINFAKKQEAKISKILI